MSSKSHRKEKPVRSTKRRRKTATRGAVQGARETLGIDSLALPARSPKREMVSMWLEDAETEMEVARTLFDKGSLRLHRAILESLHDAAEKSMKAVLIYKGVRVPRGKEGHDLVHLENLLNGKGVEIPVEHKGTLRSLILIYPRTRYEEAGPLPSEFQDRGFLEKLMNGVEELNHWLKTRSG